MNVRLPIYFHAIMKDFQEAYDYCESVIRIIQRHMEGNTDEEVLNILSDRRLPSVWINKSKRVIVLIV